MSPPPRTWTQALAARLGWLQGGARGEDLAAELERRGASPYGPSAAELERLAALHRSLLQQLSRPEGRLQRAKAMVLRVLRLYTRAQVDWNQAVLDVLAAQDRALAALRTRVEALEQDRQSNRSSHS